MLNGIEPEGPAADAGLKVGDVITKIDGQDFLTANTGDRAGKNVKLTVFRGGAEIEVAMKVGSREFQSFSLTEAANASAQQLAVRNAWLRR